jgi:hypothetical protein
MRNEPFPTGKNASLNRNELFLFRNGLLTSRIIKLPRRNVGLPAGKGFRLMAIGHFSVESGTSKVTNCDLRDWAGKGCYLI